MTLDLETLAILQKAALHGHALTDTGLELTDEVLATFEQLKDEYANSPAGSMAHIVEDLDWGKWDAFERNNERFYGPLYGDKTWDEIKAERLAEVRKQRAAQEQGSAPEAESTES